MVLTGIPTCFEPVLFRLVSVAQKRQIENDKRQVCKAAESLTIT